MGAAKARADRLSAAGTRAPSRAKPKPKPKPRASGRGGRAVRSGGRGLLIVSALVVVAVIVGITRLDFGDKIQELTLPLRHEDIIRQQAREKDVPADLIAAVINAESGFVDQTSNAGARGLMQIQPATALDIERRSGGQTFTPADLADPDINVRYGTFHLRELLDLYDDNVVAALAAYNAGPTNATSWGGSAMSLDDIEFPETRAYVERILEERRQYRSSYADELGF